MAYELLGKEVIVIKSDGYKKVGKCVNIDEHLVTIEFRNGVVEAIPMIQISTIKLAGVGDDRR